ncbi:MAG: GerMN domain-containing protein [Coprobacillaceae bacterium]
MNNKLIKNATIIGICLVCGFVYFQLTTKEPEKEVVSESTTNNYQTIVLKDKNNTLVPVEVDMGIEGEEDQIFRNMLYLMQSNEYEDIGLYPLLSSDLEVNAMQIDAKSLTFDFNDELVANSNEDALDILEGLSYTFCHNGIEQIKFKINGEEISYLPNSTIPISCSTYLLGINNFESDSLNIHRTIPVIVYNQQTINDRTYYVPITTRIEVENQDVNTQVSLLLDKIEYQEPVSLTEEISLEEGAMKVSLASNILLDNENIDQTLYQQLVKSLESIDGVQSVTLYVDDQEIVPTTDESNQVNNRIKL